MKLADTFNRYSNFEGRAPRSEYWGVMFISVALLFALWTIGFMFVAFGEVWVAVGAIIILATIVGWFWVGLATTVRRCRDADISPWFTAATFLPYVGWIVIIVLGCLESKQ